MPELEKILKDKFLYIKVPNLKFYEIKFFFKKMKEAFKKIDIFCPKKGVTRKKITGRDLQQVAIEVSYYTSAFYSAVMGFFDSLAILHTKNREEVYREVHFKAWLDFQVNAHPNDNYLKYLKKADERWITSFRRDRNAFIHHSHPFISMMKLQHVELSGGTVKVETFITELEDGRKELIPYCKRIVDKVKRLTKKVNKNIKKEYEYH